MINSNYRKLLPLAALTALLAPAAPAAADSAVSLGGYLTAGSPGSFDISALQSFAASNPSAVQTVTVGGDTYTGVSLYSYIAAYLATDSTVPKNDILRDYVTATGSDGSSITYALGNLSGSGFGTQKDIIAYSDNSGTLASAAVVAADGADVASLSSLAVGHVGYAGAGAGGVSSSLTVSGDVSATTTYTASDLPGSLTTQDITVSTPPVTGSSFTGVSLWDLLVQSGLDTTAANLLSEYVVVTGTDNYQTVFSMEEIDPAYGNQNDLVAYATGSGGSLGTSGFARIVVPGDAKAGRYVSNIDSLAVIAAVPLPGAAVMMMSGLAAVASAGLRRGRKTAI